ncbi:MAG TPA: site-specific DNA-methyltransferase, partial [Thermoclostridium caenicola]|uniref:site-specific DNA-methyltransferase n=1 Tax=Thermoclostridium caenicola TaxID=659425 RepID=UPI002BC2F930
MDKLKMHSVNKVDENIKKIAELFPNTLTEVIKGYRDDGTPIIEHAIDFDVLRQELSDIIVEGPEERYQFTWPDKKKSILLANAPIAKTLRPCREESVDFDTTENLYIEGDNLDALKLLQETYLGKVKMIYIDPPYNTGKDFLYKDDFAQDTDEYLSNSGQFDEDGNRLVQNTESNGRFHTDWLNMMYPRLKLAKDLLSDDGVIFISIDDNEVENLKKICNEVFGEKNFLVNCIWISGRTAAAHFTNSHEYIIGYAKNINMLPLFKYHGDDQLISDRTIKRPSAKNPISSIDFPAGIDFECEDKVFPSQFGDKEPVIVEKGIFECENKKLK